MSRGLQVRGLSRAFGGVLALQGLDLDVLPGECVALIGPNGAGKSTCFACLAGQLLPDAGQVMWQGQPLLGLDPAQRLARGVTRTFQVAQVFDTLSVQDNLSLVLGHARLRPWDVLARRRPARVQALLAAMALQDDAQRLPSALPYGARKRLELAMALAGWSEADQPGLLLLDEPAAGLAPHERQQMMQRVRAQAQAGAAVLYTEHHMDAVFGVADRVVVLVRGQRLFEGTPQTVAAHPEVRAAYLGEQFVWEEGGHAAR